MDLFAVERPVRSRRAARAATYVSPARPRQCGVPRNFLQCMDSGDPLTRPVLAGESAGRGGPLLRFAQDRLSLARRGKKPNSHIFSCSEAAGITGPRAPVSRRRLWVKISSPKGRRYCQTLSGTAGQDIRLPWRHGPATRTCGDDRYVRRRTAGPERRPPWREGPRCGPASPWRQDADATDLDQ
jgi:hypothetical protein